MPAPIPLTILDEAWATQGSGMQLRAVRRAAEELRAEFAAGPKCLAVRTLPLTTLPYPTRYAFQGAALSPAPFVTMTHRALLVQFLQGGQLKHLLFNPTDIDAAAATPFFAQLRAQFGERLAGLMAKRFEPLESQLAKLGILPEHIDYVAFDHFHTQDLRGLLGTEGGAHPKFPNAKLVASKSEWDDWENLHPMQQAWFVKDGREGVRVDNVILTERDWSLGDGVMILRTPGHTSGNQTLFVNTDSGVWGSSENGTCADNWSPLESRIRGVRSQVQQLGTDVLLNANTPEFMARQYTSMILERTIVDRVRSAPAFVQMFPSSEITPSLLAPGISPTLLHRAIEHGTLVLPKRHAA